MTSANYLLGLFVWIIEQVQEQCKNSARKVQEEEEEDNSITSRLSVVYVLCC